MLRLFRYNDPYRLLLVLLILLVVGLTLFTFSQPLTVQELRSILLGEMLHDGKSMYFEVVDFTPPGFAWISQSVDFLFGRALAPRHIVAILLIFFSAAYFAILLINNKAYNESTYLPALIFALLCCSSFDFFQLSPQLLAAIVLLFALNNLFREVEFRVQKDETVFNLGIYLGVASLIVFSYVVFLFGTILLLIVFTRITARKIFLLLMGFVLPHALLLCLYWYNDHHWAFINHFYVSQLRLSNETFISASSLWMIGLVPLVYFAFSLVMLNREARFTKYQSQLLQVMLIWMLIALIEIFFTRERTPHSFITIIPSLTYFISHYLLLIRRKRIAETMLWFFAIGILTMSTLSKNNRISSVNYTKMMAPVVTDSNIVDKGVMTLDGDMTVYTNNRVSGFFLNAELSKAILLHPDYYDNLILVNASFEKDAPDIIIDKNDVMKGFFRRLPKWSEKYVRDGIYYKRRTIPQLEK